METPANDNEPDVRVVTDRRTLANLESGWKARVDIERVQEAERTTDMRVAFAVDRLTNPKRQWKAANDNQSWPLAEALRREGNETLLAAAERYRAVHEAAHTEMSLVGTMPEPDMPTVQKQHLRADGSVSNKGVRRSKRASLIFDDGCRKVYAMDETARTELETGTSTFNRRPSKRITKKWAGDNLIVAAIDSKWILRRLTDALGPLRAPLEEAVLDCATLTDIGKARGVGQHAPGAGKVLVMMGLDII